LKLPPPPCAVLLVRGKEPYVVCGGTFLPYFVIPCGRGFLLLEFFLYNLSFGMIFNNKMHRYTGVLIIIFIIIFIYSLLILGEI
jgi:hypothetical protein